MYTNSPLVTYTKISPNKTSNRNNGIDTITIHCIVAQWTAKQGCDYFANTSAQSSANYVVGKDGSIGLAVEEKDRSWCTSSSYNDNRAVTIEVASDREHPYAVTDAALAALIELVADICKRNGIEKLIWSTNKSDRLNRVNGCNMTVHRDYANKACPGEYLYSRHGYIADEVNKRLGANSTTTAPTTQKLYRVRKSWDDAKSQIGAFAKLDNAKSACDTAGAGYYVFDENGKALYPVKVETQPEVQKLYRVRKSKDDAKSQKGAYANLNGAIECCQNAGDGYHVFDWDYKIVYSYKAPVVETKPVETPKEEKPIVAVYDLDYPEKIKIVDTDKNLEDDELKKNCVKAIKGVLANNADLDVEIAKAFFALAPKYGIDPMMAISQSVLETGWFKYQHSAVKPEQHNYCGLGVTSNGMTGAEFDTVEDGVRAQLQHLYAYGCKDELSETILDPRFKYVTRGIAPYWQNLAGRWAVPGYDKNTYATPEDAMKAGNTYGQKIRTICLGIDKVEVTDEDVAKYFPVEVKPNDNVEIKPEGDVETNPNDNIIDTPQNTDDNMEKEVFTFIKLLKKLFEYIVGLFKKK